MGKAFEVAMDTIGEGLLLLAIAGVGWVAHQPLVFASLGPTAYEQVARPNDRSSRLYNVAVGHFIGLASGFIAVAVCGAFDAPKVASTGLVTGPRVWAIALATALTAAGTLLAKAKQAAATSTALLVALGSMQTARDAACIVGGIVLVSVLGEPLRRLRSRQKEAASRGAGAPASPAA